MLRLGILFLVCFSNVLGQNVCQNSLTTTVPDSAFTASSDYSVKDPNHVYSPVRGRLDTKVDPNPAAYKAGSWVAVTNDKAQWLQVKLNGTSLIQAVTTEGRNPDPNNGCCAQWVTKYYVKYSMDGQTWQTVTDGAGADRLFAGNTDTDTPVTNDVGCPIIAKYVRVLPQGWKQQIALRFDLLGCGLVTGNQTAPQSAATTMSTTSGAPLGQLSSGQCVTNCTGKKDGYYQSCKGCSYFLKCQNDVMTDGMSCKNGKVWNDNVKSCDDTSPTCHGGPVGQLSNGQCVTDCTGKKNGYYQSCKGCSYFLKCQNDVMTDGMSCKNGEVWNDNVKSCDDTSPTCQGGPIGQLSSGQCVTDCTGKKNGYYQSCKGCSYFLKCQNGVMTDGMSCKNGKVWNDNVKSCDDTSPTCHVTQSSTTHPLSTPIPPTTPTPSSTFTTPTAAPSTKTTTAVASTTKQVTTPRTTSSTAVTTTPSPTTTPTPTPTPTAGTPAVQNVKRCVSDCTGLYDGDYQSCNGCQVYATCANGILLDRRACPLTLVWNDNTKGCDIVSPTCP